MTLKIYGADASIYVRMARMAAHECGAEYELVSPADKRNEAGNVDPAPVREWLQTGVIEAHNPFNQMPVLEDKGRYIFETTAICRYLDITYSPGQLVPTDQMEAIEMEQWVSATNDSLIGAIAPHWIGPHLFAGPEGPDRDRIEAGRDAIQKQVNIFNARAQESEWLGGDAFSMADIMAACTFNFVGFFEGGMEFYKNAPDNAQHLGRWWAAVSARESFSATYPAIIREAMAKMAANAH